MPCPTCDHTLEALGYCDGGTIYHCPRCGTIQHGNQFVDAPPRIYVPKLVERCREFIAEVGDDKKHCRGFFPIDVKQHWHRLGIAESINKPEDRP